VVLLNGGAGQGLNPNVYLVGLESPLWGCCGLQWSLLWRSVVQCLFSPRRILSREWRAAGWADIVVNHSFPPIVPRAVSRLLSLAVIRPTARGLFDKRPASV
jgi:hypothetical protein